MRKIFATVAAIGLFMGGEAHASAPSLVQNSYLLNLNAIKLIRCGTADGDHFAGTGWVVSHNRVATANHVIYGADYCVIDHKRVTLISKDEPNDFAVLGVELPEGQPTLEISCEGYVPGDLYYSVGWAHGTDLAVTKVVPNGDTETMEATRHYPFANAGLNAFHGFMFRGMSGGPVINGEGKVVGLNNTSDEEGYATSRPLADTSLCSALSGKHQPLYPLPPKKADDPETAFEFFEKVQKLGPNLIIPPLPAPAPAPKK